MDLELAGSFEEPVAPAPRPPAPVPLGRATFRAMGRQILGCALVMAVAYGCFEFITHYVLQSVQVVGASMTPTLHDSDRYILNRWVYHLRDPKPSEIVVLRDPVDNCYAVKRIVAKAGDSVYVKGGQLYINGKLLDEPYLPSGTLTFAGPRFREQLWVCGVDQYFVLGDNRNNSADSRIYGAVARQNILGLVVP